MNGYLKPQQLDSLAVKLASQLLSSTSKPAKYINYQIELLEIVSYETKRLDKLGYCDFEMGYLCYILTQTLLKECKQHPTNDIKDLIGIIEATLAKKQEKFQICRQFITETDDIDPLMSRFNNLSAGPTATTTTGSQATTKADEITTTGVSVDSFKHKGVITPTELHFLLSNKDKILLIDFRTKNEFNYNHINYTDIVNIDPGVVNTLLGPENKTNADNVTDQDLEERLRMLLAEDQYTRFSNRHKYELVVMYNLKYGTVGGDRFENLANSLISGDVNGNPSKQPFTKLIDIITYRNKYISSKLKRAPCYLAGGVANWFKIYGESSIVKTNETPILARPPASISRDGSSSPSSSSYRSSSVSKDVSVITNGSPYLKNFGDYLGTAKTTNTTPVSNPFRGDSYVPSAPLKVPNLGAVPSTVPSTSTASQSTSMASQSTSMASQSTGTKTSTSTGTKLTRTSSSANDYNPVQFLEQYTTGLTNLGNSCYMNCILQCLGATPQLTKFFFPTFPLTKNSPSVSQSYRQHINVNNKLGTKGILTTNFVNLLMNMFGNSGGNFSPSNFKKVIGSLSPGQQFANFDQQDCIEFLNFLLDSLHEDLNQMVVADAKEKQAIMELTPEQEYTREILPVRLASTIEWERYLKLNFSIVVDYFQGQYLSQLKCLECGLTSTSYNAFSILSLPIPEKLNHRQITLDDCLQEFVELELLDDDNKWHCPRCKKFTRSTKKITITRLPQVLIIHFKRFQISPMGYFSKLDTFIKYPVNDTLDLTKYWPDVGTSVNSNLNSSEIMSKEKETQILATLPARNQTPPFRYKLYGVANHYGNLTTGHYTAYVHKQSDTKKKREWCYFDDSRVTFNHKENDVLNKNAYCLFYQRI
ncbi:ubiquitin carboxyl-terminal hydrolase 5 [[Candida] jaroonii]|uniref:Ubiquitin carboxyl-terminal hydrolase 5 n=1 Tax=[Candida] jaroonii TaxID=467808 RepID=A0ACA9Y5F6_9ASCO|nr:ubiquitin carboxyl-terminal hydrolase 5 [[Candida] jaroonii]